MTKTPLRSCSSVSGAASQTSDFASSGNSDGGRFCGVSGSSGPPRPVKRSADSDEDLLPPLPPTMLLTLKMGPLAQKIASLSV